MVFCNKLDDFNLKSDKIVTILILIDGFLQSKKQTLITIIIISHNPYFNRWFSAIGIDGYLPMMKYSSQSLF